MKINLKKYLLFFVICTVFFITATQVLPIRWDDNDDVTMAWLASGTYSGTPDCHLEYINALYGTFLNVLYNFLPSIEWYTVLFSIWHIIAFSIILYYAWEIAQKRSRVLFICFSVLMSILWLWIITRFQFTTTASILALASIILIIDKKFICGGILLLLASLIRYQAAGLTGIVMFPMLIFKFRTDIYKSWCPFLCILSLVYIAHKADNCFYQETGWANYRELDRYRGKINDNPNSWRTIDHLPFEMQKENYFMVLGFFVDPCSVSIQELKQISHYLHKEIPLYKRAKNIWQKMIPSHWKWILVIAICYSLIIFTENKYIEKFFLTSSSAIWFFTLCFIALNGTVKNRVFISALFPIIIVYYFYIAKLPKEKTGNIALCVLIVGALCINGIHIINRHNTQDLVNTTLHEQMALINRNSGMYIVTSGADFSVELINPFHMTNAIKSHQFINSYCMMGSPVNNDRLASHKDLLNTNICLFSKKGNDNFGLLKETMFLNYGLQVDTSHIDESANYVLVRIIEAKE